MEPSKPPHPEPKRMSPGDRKWRGSQVAPTGSLPEPRWLSLLAGVGGQAQRINKAVVAEVQQLNTKQ